MYNKGKPTNRTRKDGNDRTRHETARHAHKDRNVRNTTMKRNTRNDTGETHKMHETVETCGNGVNYRCPTKYIIPPAKLNSAWYARHNWRFQGPSCHKFAGLMPSLLGTILEV